MHVRTIAVFAAVALSALAAAADTSDPLAEQIRSVYRKVVPSTVIVSYTVQREDGARANVHLMGTVVGPNNLVMIAAAAVPSQLPASQLKDFRVSLVKGDETQVFSAEYLGRDEDAQVAFLRVTDPKAPALPVLEFQPGVELGIGDPVVTFASLGEPDRYERVVRLARVAARMDQPITTYLTGEGLGSPGTPAVTLDGRAMGIVGLARVNRATNAQPNWATMEVILPAERFLDVIRNPPRGGATVRHAWLGAPTLTPVTKDLADYFQLGSRRGVVVGQVVEKGPADKAGLKPEDIILALDGKNLAGTEGQLVENFLNDISRLKVGQTVTLTIWRGGKTQDVKVTLEAEPKRAAEAERYRSVPVGLTVREMVLADRLARELPASEGGVVVAYVTAASWAADSGLKAEDVIKKVQDQDTPTLAEFRRVFEAEVKKRAREIVLFVLRGKKDTQLVRIETRWAQPPQETPAPRQPDAAKAP